MGFSTWIYVIRRRAISTSQSPEKLVCQAKLGSSDQMKVLVRKGLTNHLY